MGDDIMRLKHKIKKTTHVQFLTVSFLLVVFGSFFVSSIYVSAASTDDDQKIFASDQLNITPLKYSSHDLDSGVYEELNVRPYGTYLSNFNNLGGVEYGDEIIYTSRLEFTFYLNMYTSVDIEEAFKFTPGTYSKISETYLTVYKRPNCFYHWENDDTRSYKYTYSNLVYSIQNKYEYKGNIDAQISMNQNLIKYNNSVISSMDYSIEKVVAQDFQTGIVGEYENIFDIQTYDTGFASTGYTTSSDFNTIRNDAGDLSSQVNDWLNNPTNVKVEPQSPSNKTLQNFVATPLTQTEQLNIISGAQTDTAVFRIPSFNIRPQLTVMERKIVVRKAKLYIDTGNDWGSYGIVSPTESWDADLQTQNIALFARNQFVSQKYYVIVYASAAVQKSYFEENLIDFQDPVILKGEWIWNSDLQVQGGTVNVFGTDLTPSTIVFIIVAIVALVLVIYFAPQLTAYLAGVRASRSQSGSMTLPQRKTKTNGFKLIKDVFKDLRNR
jgi:hypothetical protein